MSPSLHGPPRALAGARRRVPFGGCLLGPDYVRPATPEPAAWHEPLGAAFSSAPADRDELATWWTVLGDPLLSDLVSRTLDGNLDVQVARERVKQAREHRSVAEANLWPTLRAKARAGPGIVAEGDSWRRTRALLDPRPVRQAAPQRRSRARRSGRQRGGAARRARERRRRSRAELRRRARLPGAPGDRRSEPRRGDARPRTSRLAAQAGLTTRARRRARQTDLAQTHAQIPSLRAGLEEAKNRLALLLGETPGALSESSTQRSRLPTAPVERSPSASPPTRWSGGPTCAAPSGSSPPRPRASASRRPRPIRRSAHRRRRHRRDCPSTFTNPASLGAVAAAQIVQVLFDHGAVRATIKGQQAVRSERVAHFQSTVLAALDDVENAIVEYTEEQNRQRGLVEASALGSARRRAVAGTLCGGARRFPRRAGCGALALLHRGAARRQRGESRLGSRPPLPLARRRLEHGGLSHARARSGDAGRRADSGSAGDEADCPATHGLRRLAALGAVALFGLVAARHFVSAHEEYATQPARTGDLVVSVTATGPLEPTEQVDIGSELSGTLRSVEVDYNAAVHAGQVLARLDTTRLEAQALQAKSSLEAAQAAARRGAREPGRDAEPARATSAPAGAQRREGAFASRSWRRRRPPPCARKGPCAARWRPSPRPRPRWTYSRPTSPARDPLADRRRRARGDGAPGADRRGFAPGTRAVHAGGRPDAAQARPRRRRGRRRARPRASAGALQRGRVAREDASAGASSRSAMARARRPASSATRRWSRSTTPSCCCGPG